MKKNVLIIGYGIVGKNLSEELSKINPDIVDKYKPEFNTIKDIHYDLGFICVDTPLKDGTLDITEVKNAIKTSGDEIDVKVYVKQGPNIASVQEADKIIIMENGKIDAVGKHDDLLKNNAIYQEVYYSLHLKNFGCLFLVNLFNLVNSFIWPCCNYFYQSIFISSQSFHCIINFITIIINRRIK